jgi:cbb3-type cytochrome oxidase maturation protein
MDILLYLIPIALTLGAVGLAGFLWSLKSGQFDDLDGAKWRVLSDADLPTGKAAPDSAYEGGERANAEKASV